jgi:hypothetical protein
MEDNADECCFIRIAPPEPFCRAFYGRLCRFGFLNYIQTIKVGFIKLDRKPIAPNEKSGPRD